MQRETRLYGEEHKMKRVSEVHIEEGEPENQHSIDFDEQNDLEISEGRSM